MPNPRREILASKAHIRGSWRTACAAPQDQEKGPNQPTRRSLQLHLGDICQRCPIACHSVQHDHRGQSHYCQVCNHHHAGNRSPHMSEEHHWTPKCCFLQLHLGGIFQRFPIACHSVQHDHRAQPHCSQVCSLHRARNQSPHMSEEHHWTPKCCFLRLHRGGIFQRCPIACHSVQHDHRGQPRCCQVCSLHRARNQSLHMSEEHHWTPKRCFLQLHLGGIF